MVAFLFIAEGAIDDGRFEDYVRLMYPHYANHNVPTYIIGQELGGGPMECLRPDEFNPRIVELAAQRSR